MTKVSGHLPEGEAPASCRRACGPRCTCTCGCACTVDRAGLLARRR